MSSVRWLPLCAGEALRDGGDGQRFEVRAGVVYWQPDDEVRAPPAP